MVDFEEMWQTDQYRKKKKKKGRREWEVSGRLKSQQYLAHDQQCKQDRTGKESSGWILKPPCSALKYFKGNSKVQL